MNNVFKWSRFRRLFLKHTREHYKGYLMSLTVLLGIMILGGSFLVYMADIPIDEGLQGFLFMSMLLLSGTIFTSTVFADLGNKRKSIAWLTLPATHFEKYLVAWIYTVIIFGVIYTTSFYLIVLGAVHVKTFPGHSPRLFNVFQKEVMLVFLVYAFLHGISFWGAIFFKRLHFIKTAFVFFVSFALLVLINRIVLSLALGRHVEAAAPFGYVRVYINDSIADINIPRQQQNGFMLGLLTILAVIFWMAAFYRLKEKQV